MKCENFKELILEYPDGELSQSERLRVETHLRECEGCDLLFKQVNGVWNLLDRWDGIEPEGDFVAKFWDRVSEGEVRGGILDFFRNWRSGWAIAVSVAVILIVSIISINVFESDRADVVFTEIDRADEELLIKLERVTSRETAKSLEVYGPGMK
jgi:Predicted transmembrane transcriptional regulator (anti-sigma factor)